MLDTVDGLPVHPLVVHAVVVLLPLAVLGTIAIAIVPRWRLRYGPLVLLAAVLSVALMPVATSSGEALEERVGEPGTHAELGEQLIWVTLPLVALVAALVYLARRQARSTADGPRPSRPSGLVTGVAVLAVVAGLAAAVQVYRVGDSGARAAWGDQVAADQGGD